MPATQPDFKQKKMKIEKQQAAHSVNFGMNTEFNYLYSFIMCEVESPDSSIKP